jgi:hypothetical protein
LSEFLGIVASLIGIFIPIIELFFKKSAGTGEGEPSVVNVTQYFFGGRNQSNRRSNADKNIDRVIELIGKDYSFLESSTPIIIAISITFSIGVFAVQEINHNLFFIADYVHGVLQNGTKNKEFAYIVAFSIPFIGFLSVSYFFLWYVCDLRLRTSLSNAGCLGDVPKLEKIKNIFFNSNEIRHFNIYPMQTIDRLIENGKIKKRNNRKIKRNHENEQGFFSQKLVILSIAIMLVMHFSFQWFFSDNAIEKSRRFNSHHVSNPH